MGRGVGPAGQGRQVWGYIHELQVCGSRWNQTKNTPKSKEKAPFSRLGPKAPQKLKHGLWPSSPQSLMPMLCLSLPRRPRDPLSARPRRPAPRAQLGCNAPTGHRVAVTPHATLRGWGGPPGLLRAPSKPTCGSLSPSLWLHRGVAFGQAWSLGFPQPQHTLLLPTLW